MTTVVNGWDLAAQPADAHSLFGLEWINDLAAAKSELNLHLVVPDAGQPIRAAEGIEVHTLNLHHSAMAQMRFEQLQLVHFANKLGAEVLLYPTGGAPLISSMPVVTFPPGYTAPASRSILGRLGWAVRRAGHRGAFTKLRVLEPDEEGRGGQRIVDLPAWVSSSFNPLQQPSDQDVLDRHSLSPGYVISMANDHNRLGRILEVWRWLMDTVDPGQPLVLMGLASESVHLAQSLVTQLELDEWVKIVEVIFLNELPAIYRQAACYFHGTPSRSGQELRWALAAGVPVAGIETPLSSRIVGQAGYLAPQGDTRGLVAACVTIIVEPKVADDLRKKGLTRAREYHHGRFFDVVAEVLEAARLS